MAPNLIVQFARERRLNRRQQLRHRQRWHAKRRRQAKRRSHVQANHPVTPRAAYDPQLAAQTLHQIPDLPALQRFRLVQPPRAVRANALARLAIVTAPAEFPFGKSGQPFFSASTSIAPATICS